MLIINKSRKPTVAVIVVGALAAIGVAVWLSAGKPAEPSPPGETVATSTSSTPSPSPGGASPHLPGAPPPIAFAEPVEDPSSVFELGHNGGLVVDPSTLSSLDRLHASLGDNPTAEDHAKMEKQLREGLPKADADKAIKLLQGYRAYTADMRTDVMNLGVPQTREEADRVLSRITDLQSRHFDRDSAEAMFGQQNRLSKAVLDAALIQMDTSLSNEQKKERLAAVRETMPPDQRSAIPDMPAEPASAPA